MPTVVDIPLYEPLIMGNPFYLMIIMGMGALIVLGAIAFKTEVYDIMQPVWGFRAAASSGKPQMLVIGMNGKMWLETVDHVANIFRSLTLPLMWIITIPVVGQMGKVNTSIVSDDWNIIHNVDIDYAIVEIVHNWNAREDTKPEEEREYIHNFDSFNYHLLSGHLTEMYPEGVVLPPVRVVTMKEVKNYLPKWDAAHHAGYINQEVNKRKGDTDNKGMELIKYALVAAAIVGLVFVLGYIMITNARPMNCG